MAGRRLAPWLLVVLLLASVLTACQARGGGVVTTIAVPNPALGPAPVGIPANPRQVVVMRPGPASLNLIQTQFVEDQPGYIGGSGKVEAVYPGADGPSHILVWNVIEPQFGEMRCSSITPPDELPMGHGCSGPIQDLPFTINGYGYTTEPGAQVVTVEHSPDAEAVVIELEDASSFVIRPRNSSVSHHEWNGPPPVRVTMFWADGSTTSEEFTP